MSQNYRDLIVWQKAMDLVEAVYRATSRFPPDERYGLTLQVRRAVTSIPSNIAEGQGRRSRTEFRQFLSIAQGSLREVETQLLIGLRLGYIPDDVCESALSLSGEVERMIRALARSIEREN